MMHMKNWIPEGRIFKNQLFIQPASLKMKCKIKGNSSAQEPELQNLLAIKQCSTFFFRFTEEKEFTV